MEAFDFVGTANTIGVAAFRRLADGILNVYATNCCAAHSTPAARVVSLNISEETVDVRRGQSMQETDCGRHLRKG